MNATRQLDRRRRKAHQSTPAYRLLALTIMVIASSSACRLDRTPSIKTPSSSHREASAGEPSLRVRLRRQLSSSRIEGPNEVIVTPLGRPSQLLVLLTPIDIRLKRFGFFLRDGRGGQHEFDRTDSLQIRPAGATPLSLDGNAHSSPLELTPSNRRSVRFDIIELVPMERYLAGVLNKELYPKWSRAAYEAQAIAARSYALHERGRRRDRGDDFDIESTTKDQAYSGATDNQRAINAANATRGMVLMHHGELLRAYYSSTCGGRPSSAADIWPIGDGFSFNRAEPIQAHKRRCPDEFSHFYRWSATRDKARFVQRLRVYGARHHLSIEAIRTLASVSVALRNVAGRPKAYTIVDQRGRRWRLSAEHFRLACNQSDPPGLPPPDQKKLVRSGDCEVEVTRSSVIIHGRGFGHGVGMCQYGAEGMARQGYDAQAILRRYYPGADLRRAY